MSSLSTVSTAWNSFFGDRPGSLDLPTSTSRCHAWGVGTVAGKGRFGTSRQLSETGPVSKSVRALEIHVQRKSHSDKSLLHLALKRRVAAKDSGVGRRIHHLRAVAESQADTKRSAPKRASRRSKEVTSTLERATTAEPIGLHQVPDGLKTDEQEDGGNEPEPNDWPPLVCCFGEAVNEFLPTVRVSSIQMDPHIYSTWKRLQWSPPEFNRAPGGPACNTAISLSRLGGRVAFMGTLGRDTVGDALLLTLNVNGVQTRGVKLKDTGATGVSSLHLKQGVEGVTTELASPPAESMFLKSDINVDILKEAQMFYFTSLSLTMDPLASTLHDALTMAIEKGANIFFDLNLPLPFWQSQEETLDKIEAVWFKSNFVELTKHELEFLLGEEVYRRRRKKQPTYYARTPRELKKRRHEYHYEPNEIEPLWHAGMKCMFVTDGTYRIHYYTPDFHGSVAGTEDVLLTPFTCDRTGSGDALVAGIIRKLTTQPEILQEQEKLEKALRFAICVGIISQWSTGAIKGSPTESAAQSLLGQVYIPSMI